jgi:hypothetical protein
VLRLGRLSLLNFLNVAMIGASYEID